MIVRILQNPSDFLSSQIERWDGESKQWIHWDINTDCITLGKAKVKKKDELIWLAGEYIESTDYHPEFSGDVIDWDNEYKIHPIVYWMDSFTAYY